MMDQYKCPICGNNEYVEADILSTGADREETVFDKKYGNLVEGKVNHSLPARGLVNYTCSASSMEGGVEVNLLFTNNCTTKVCTKCGFVSMHALSVANGILNDIASLKQNDEDLLKTRDSIVAEIEALKAEEENMPRREAEICEQLKDENITIKQQKELQAELEDVRQRIKRVPGLIKDKQQDLQIIDERRSFLLGCKKYISGHKITK